MPDEDRLPDGGTRGVDFPDDEELRNRMRFRDELKYSFDNHVQWLVESEQHLLKIFRFYILVLGAFISILSLLIGQTSIDFANVLNVYTVSAVVFWTVAVLSAVFAFAVIWIPLGIDAIHHDEPGENRKGEFREGHENRILHELNLYPLLDDSSETFEETVLSHYVGTIHHNERQLKIRYTFLFSGMALVLVAVLVFGFGILVPDGGQYGWWPAEWAFVRVVAIGLELLGLGVSAFLLLQMLSLRGRLVLKIGMSEAMAPGLGEKWLQNKLSNHTRLEPVDEDRSDGDS